MYRNLKSKVSEIQNFCLGAYNKLAANLWYKTLCSRSGEWRCGGGQLEWRTPANLLYDGSQNATEASLCGTGHQPRNLLVLGNW